ncbi:hypothetical protein [Dysgonomonas sp. 25]|uniref:hypothetical protein n=1 Tax=Dysgonomonas sp. 25 TaxID=2302933 RepID=UPI0013D3B13A|nr:hypothetical protein [Dysgonomonas sp. 25]NDV69956.1 hypothetical protein [Dysgonomonas sp. 25]
MIIEDLSKKLSVLLSEDDDLSRIEMEVDVETILNQVQEKGYLDTELLIDLSFAGVPFIDYLKRYKNISGDEARALVHYRDITFEILMNILEFGINSCSKK